MHPRRVAVTGGSGKAGVAARLAVMSDRMETDADLVAASDTCMTRESWELLEEVYPGVELTRALLGYEMLLAVDKARADPVCQSVIGPRLGPESFLCSFFGSIVRWFQDLLSVP